MRLVCPLLCLVVLGIYTPGCGTSDPAGGTGADGGGGGGGDTPDGGGGGDGWQTLIQGSWSIPAGSEGYHCVRATVPEDMYISEFRAIIPLGTHHTVLATDSAGGADGEFDCSANTLGDGAIFGSGVGTNSIAFPPGVAVKLSKGQQLLLNLHLFNISDSALTGTSGTKIKTIPADQVEHEAEVVLMGNVFNLHIPPGESTQTGRCVMNGDVTLFAVNPHMHQLGTHMKVVAKSSVEGDVTMHDGDYDFENQAIYPIDPMVQMKAGDEVDVYCTYNNTTGKTVSFGDSTLDEMCFGTTYRYPARGGQFGVICDSGTL